MTGSSTNKPIGRYAVLAVCAVWLTFPAVSSAHRLRPAIVTITLHPGGTYDATIALNAEALLAGIGVQHEDTDDSPNAGLYNGLRQLPPAGLQARITAFGPELLAGIDIAFDGLHSPPELVAADVPAIGRVDIPRITTLRLHGPVPGNAQRLTWSWPAEYGSSAVRVGRAGEPVVQTAFLAPGQVSDPFPIGAPLRPRSSWRIAVDYIGIGFTHIVPKGLDHILFVLGIYLLSVAWRPLLYQVTAFTVAHTITLGLSLYGLISLPPSIVEPLIAASIVYVGIENIWSPRLRPWRVFIVFGFGLLHGLGFAGVLSEIGLPEGEFLNALISFNIGVETGQLAVLAGAWLAVGRWFGKRSWYRARIVVPCSAAIAGTGAWWAVERVIA